MEPGPYKRDSSPENTVLSKPNPKCPHHMCKLSEQIQNTQHLNVPKGMTNVFVFFFFFKMGFSM